MILTKVGEEERNGPDDANGHKCPDEDAEKSLADTVRLEDAVVEEDDADFGEAWREHHKPLGDPDGLWRC